MAKLTNPFDDEKFVTVKELEDYIKENYSDKIPKEYNGDISHFLYDYRNEPRKCQVCGMYTDWNPKLKKYNVICSKNYDKYANKYPYLIWNIKSIYVKYVKNRGNTCEEVMRKIYLNNIKNARGTDNLLADPEYQKQLLENRKIAKKVKYNNKLYVVIGSYEAMFLNVLSFLKNPPEIEAPGPTINFEGKTTITDFYFPKYKLIVSIKDNGNNTNYVNNYEKACDIYYYMQTHDTGYKYIELNGVDQIKRAKDIIRKYIKGEYELTDPDIMPIYMEQYSPEKYEKLKHLNK